MDLNAIEAEGVRRQEMDDWESVTPVETEPDDYLFVFVEEDVVGSCEVDL